MTQGIEVQHLVSYVHTQNGLAESLIKRIKLIARQLLHNLDNFPEHRLQSVRLDNFPEHRLQSVRLDNVIQFSSRSFNDYCMTQGIEVQHLVSYVHTQNGLVESLIKRIKLIA
jgi:hypothetical protein